MNVVKCNQAHSVFKYNFVVTGKSAVCISNFMPLSLDGCWSNFHLVYKILFLPFDWSTKFISSTQPIRCKMTIYVKPIRAQLILQPRFLSVLNSRSNVIIFAFIRLPFVVFLFRHHINESKTTPFWPPSMLLYIWLWLFKGQVMLFTG